MTTNIGKVLSGVGGNQNHAHGLIFVGKTGEDVRRIVSVRHERAAEGHNSGAEIIQTSDVVETRLISTLSGGGEGSSGMNTGSLGAKC